MWVHQLQVALSNLNIILELGRKTAGLCVVTPKDTKAPTSSVRPKHSSKRCEWADCYTQHKPKHSCVSTHAYIHSERMISCCARCARVPHLGAVKASGGGEGTRPSSPAQSRFDTGLGMHSGQL